jgi:hypothetical protein
MPSADGGYSLLNVAAGQYAILAGVDSNGNGKTDHVGFYGVTGFVAVQPPASGINVRLVPVQESASFMASSAETLFQAFQQALK